MTELKWKSNKEIDALWSVLRDEMISQADLPITKAGRIYHLDLLPTELANTVITVGDPARVETVSQHFDSIECEHHHREFKTHTGTLKGKKISVISTGIGTPNIDIVMNELDALKNIDFKTRLVKKNKEKLKIIRFGTTGGLDPKADVGATVVSSMAIGLDGLLNYYKWPKTNNCEQLIKAFNEHMGELPINPYAVTADSQLLKHFYSLGPCGITVTCPGFYGPQDRHLRAKPAINQLAKKLMAFSYKGNDVMNFEMETASIFGMSRLLGHQALSIAVVLANRVTGKFHQTPNALIEGMVQKGMDKISDL